MVRDTDSTHLMRPELGLPRLFFNVGAYRDHRRLTYGALITDQRQAALRCIDLMTPPSCARHSTSSSLMAVHSGTSA